MVTCLVVSAHDISFVSIWHTPTTHQSSSTLNKHFGVPIDCHACMHAWIHPCILAIMQACFIAVNNNIVLLSSPSLNAALAALWKTAESFLKVTLWGNAAVMVSLRLSQCNAWLYLYGCKYYLANLAQLAHVQQTHGM